MGYSKAVLNEDIYSSRWDLSNNLSLSARTPFYIGKVGLTIDFFEYLSIQNEGFDFKSVNYSIDFGYDLPITEQVSVYAAIGTGIQRLNIPKEFSETNTSERELMYLMKLEPRFYTKHVIFFAEVEYRKIFYYVRQSTFFSGGGIRIKLYLNERLQEFIK